MLGAACVQVAFNLGNAIGAYAGGLAVNEGYRYPALTGVPFALIGFTLFLIIYIKRSNRQNTKKHNQPDTPFPLIFKKKIDFILQLSHI